MEEFKYLVQEWGEHGTRDWCGYGALNQEARLSVYWSVYLSNLTYGHKLWVVTGRRRLWSLTKRMRTSKIHQRLRLELGTSMFWTDSWGGLGMSVWETPGYTQDSLEGLYLMADLGMSHYSPQRASKLSLCFPCMFTIQNRRMNDDKSCVLSSHWNVKVTTIQRL